MILRGTTDPVDQSFTAWEGWSVGLFGGWVPCSKTARFAVKLGLPEKSPTLHPSQANDQNEKMTTGSAAANA
jgi:hypothetical protein